MAAVDATAPGARTEADVDARIVLPYLAALGVQPNQVRAQHTFSLRLGRNMIHNVGGAAVRTGRLDYLVVTADGRPLFVVEEKAPSEALTDDDRDQGVSYARLVDPIAPLVLVTNGAESYLYDTITKELLTDPGAAALVCGGGRLTDAESLRVRAEALEHFVGYSAAHVAAFSRAQRDARMATLRGDTGRHTRKYERDLYLRRDAVRGPFGAFLDGDCVAFALGGESGCGKTNEMCALAEEYGERHVTLFFNGADLPGPLAQVLADEFAWYFSEALPLPQIARRLAALADRSGRPVLIFVDAVDEAGDPGLPRELADLAGRLEQFGGRIRLIVSAKPDEWRRFTTFRGNPSPLHGRVFVPRERTQPWPASGDMPPHDEPPLSAVVGLFEPSEHEQAVAGYTAAFGLSSDWWHDVREFARDPFMLRMIAEVAAATGSVPDDPGERDLVRHYVEQKVRRIADPERARRELVAVAKALAENAVTTERAAAMDAGAWHTRPTEDTAEGGPSAAAGWSSVPETAARAAAGLPATAAIADELVAFGVLVRSRDRDGNARLAFAYDRVRDYMLATHAFELPALGREDFRAAALACFATPQGAAALSWYLPYTTDGQWAGFVDAATQRVGRVVDAYEALRAHVAPAVRAEIDPRGAGAVGAAFSGTRAGFFALGFFRRASDDLPRVCYDPAVGDFYSDDPWAGMIPAGLMSTRQGRPGFWSLRYPELYAATHVKAELERIVKGGLLAEADETLVEERVVALAIQHGRTLGLPAARQRPVVRFADRFIGRDVLPLDLAALRRLVQIALAFRSYQNAHMDARVEEQRRAQHAAGVAPTGIGASSNSTDADLRAWRERAVREVDEGRSFTHVALADPDLVALARALDLLLPRTATIEQPLLPPPDAPDADTLAGVHVFEDAYSDEQLARLVETVFDRARRAYDRVVADSFGEPLRALLQDPPPQLGVICRRRPLAERMHRQFDATLSTGAAAPVDPGVLEGRRAIAATVSTDGTTRLDPVAGSAWDVVVTSPHGRFLVHVRRLSEFSSVVWTSDAPPFARDGSTGAARLAPVRGLLYQFAREAIEGLSPEGLRALIGGAPG